MATWIDAHHAPIHASWTRTTDPTLEPLTGTQAEDWVHDATGVEIETIEALIQAARQKVEDDTGLGLLTQTITQYVDRLPRDGMFTMAVGPVQSVSTVKAYSVANVASTIATSVYRVDTSSLPARIVLKDGQSWPTDVRPQDAYEIVYVVGWTSYALMPAPLLLAMRMLVDHWFHYRGVVGAAGHVAREIDLAYSALIGPHVLRPIL